MCPPPPSTPTLTLAPSGLSAPVDAGQSLLEAALAAGIRLPSSCRNGTCRACICHVEAGEVRYRVEWPGLSREEKAEGWTLPCVALPLGDVTLLQPEACSVFDDAAGAAASTASP